MTPTISLNELHSIKNLATTLRTSDETIKKAVQALKPNTAKAGAGTFVLFAEAAKLEAFVDWVRAYQKQAIEKRDEKFFSSPKTRSSKEQAAHARSFQPHALSKRSTLALERIVAQLDEQNTLLRELLTVWNSSTKVGG